MASSAAAQISANSRLAQMQMRFQQKQQQEREQRRIEMTTTTTSTTTTTTPTASTGSTLAEDISDVVGGAKAIGNGKVRQMFDERRRGAGIDRSHPLKPIASTMTSTLASKTSSSVRNTKSTATLMGSTRGAAAAGGRKAPVVRSTVNATARAALSRSSNQTHNGNHHQQQQQQHDHIDGNGNFAKQFTSMSLNEHELIGDRNNNRHNNNNSSNSNGNGMSRETSSNGIKLNPVVTKKSPVMAQAATAPTATRATRQATPMVHNAAAARPAMGVRSPATPPKGHAATVKSPPKSVGKMSISSGPRYSNQPTQDGMATCHFCGRHFNEDRLAKHEQVCQKMMNSKRKIFDASKHRVKGTEAEKYQPRKMNARSNARVGGFMNSVSSPMNAAAAAKKNNWRQKHEEFIAAIRAAKQVQAHIARGGKLSDLPPPPPSENLDYIQCPHCLRRFNEAAAERHIPKCANMLHNKPKPGLAQRRR